MDVIKLLAGECWRWHRAHNNKGYGTFRRTMAHRVSYEAFVGPIPEGYDVHHECETRDCVNPSHLRAVPIKGHRGFSQTLRTHCPKGHPYDAANTHVRKTGKRQCRACNREAKSREKARS